MPSNLMHIHREIVACLKDYGATFAHPLSSDELGKILNVTPSYVRERVQFLVTHDFVGVRHGRGGGYYMIRNCRKRIITSNKQWTKRRVSCGENNGG